jgi:AcrR family transcriptional regulator
MELVYHDRMPIPSQDPRANQKERTRTAVVDAALDLLREDTTPTVATAAERARVSRTTAYRYFPTQEALFQEVANRHPAVAAVDEAIENLHSEDVEERLLELLDTFNPIVLADEVHMRTALQVFHENWLEARRDGNHSEAYIRSRRRMRWLDEVLRPLVEHLPETQYKRLRAALALTVGVDSIVIMKDVCQLDDDEALDVLRWAATNLLHAGLVDDQSQAHTARRRKTSND